MREILFRGRTTAGKEWVSGFYAVYSTAPFIGAPNPQGTMLWFEVDPATVGQFTGLTDKSGKRIFEGDIVRGRHWTSRNDKKPEDFHLWRVDWNEKSGLITFVGSPTTKARMSIHDFADFGEAEVIGNIHDTPELLKMGK